MKKLLLIGLAAAAVLSSCQDKTIDRAPEKAIAFENAFINKTTRSVSDPSFTMTGDKRLTDFAVYGYADEVQIFYDKQVTYDNVNMKWTYADVVNWQVGKNHTFAAIAPSSVKATNVTMGTNKVNMLVNFTNDGTTDLLHAAPAQVMCDEAFAQNPQRVGLTFAHQLAKAKFTFANQVGTEYTIKVTDIKISNARRSARLTIGGTTNVWSNHSGYTVLNFGDAKTDDVDSDIIAFNAEMESYNEMLMIPTTTDNYSVEFTVELFENGVTKGTFDHTSQINGLNLQMGRSYNFRAVLTKENVMDEEMLPIDFTVTAINSWTTGGNTDLVVE